MRKTALLAFMLVLGMVACKRQYKCVCTNDGFDAINVYEKRFNKKQADQEKVKCETDTTCIFKNGN